MIRIALTGSIGMGKSTVAAMFERRGIPVFDADSEVRRLQGVGGALVERIGERFPGTVEGGVLDRDALAGRVLGDPAELAALEAMVHPAVQEAREKFIADNRDKPALLFEIPLLYESGAESGFDRVVVVSAPADVQRRRVLARPGMSEQKLDAILARQLPDADKRKRADFIVDTGGSLAESERQVEQILACLGLAAGE
ncbi:MAG TPA: dephospho-CoA kinase [Sphingomicrobium sp.]|nr:dephospho-CoA kinase [Sphingomicrobium sp.]